MKKAVISLFLLVQAGIIFSQVEPKTTASKHNLKAFAEFSPFLAFFKLVSVGGGIEFCEYQAGFSFSKGDHHFSHGLSKTTFANFGDLHFLHYQTEEIYLKRFFNSERKGFYAALLLNLTHWKVQNHEEGIYKNVIGKYLTTYTGYRWFPFNKKNSVFYLEPNFGVSVRLNGKDFTQVGEQSFTFLQPPFELTPNILMGARFRIKN